MIYRLKKPIGRLARPGSSRGTGIGLAFSQSNLGRKRSKYMMVQGGLAAFLILLIAALALHRLLTL